MSRNYVITSSICFLVESVNKSTIWSTILLGNKEKFEITSNKVERHEWKNTVTHTCVAFLRNWIFQNKRKEANQVQYMWEFDRMINFWRIWDTKRTTLDINFRNFEFNIFRAQQTKLFFWNFLIDTNTKNNWHFES